MKRRRSDDLWAVPSWAKQHWGGRRGQPWSEAEYDLACTMRFYRRGPSEVAAAIGRTKGSVTGKLGYWPEPS